MRKERDAKAGGTGLILGELFPAGNALITHSASPDPRCHGKQDGARKAFENVDKSLTQAKKAIPHNRLGRPKGT